MAKKHKKDPKSWNIKRRRDGDKHIQACKKGYVNAGKDYMQVHHILPVTCLSDGSISKAVNDDKDTIKVIRNCLKLTNWDINAEPNCIALPLKPAYHDPKAPAGWGWLPSHQVDHPPYTEEVAAHLKKMVWDPIAEQAEECKDFKSSITGQLEAASSHWLGQLKGRGARPIGPAGGTEYCWAHRANPGMEDLWYLPFSMAAYPTPRSPPALFASLSADMKAYLKKIFTIVR